MYFFLARGTGSVCRGIEIFRDLLWERRCGFLPDFLLVDAPLPEKRMCQVEEGEGNPHNLCVVCSVFIQCGNEGEGGGMEQEAVF